MTVSDRIILDENETEAPEASGGPVKVQVNRTIKANEWSTICLPFDMTGNQVSTAFGDGVVFGDFKGYTYKEDDDDNIVQIYVKFQEVDAVTNGIEANHPYIIKVSSAVDKIIADNVVISPSDNLTIATVNRTRKQWSEMTGTYEAETVIEENCLFLSQGKFWYSKGKTKMQAFRAFFDLYDVITEVENSSSCVSFNFEDADGIVHPIVLGQPASGVYDLQGRKVGESESECGALGKGVYIINGKKVVR